MKRMKAPFCVMLACLPMFCRAAGAFAAGDDPLYPGSGNAESAAEEVFAGEETASGEILTVNADAPIPVAAKADLLMDAATGTVLAEKNGDERLYPASVTKIMTLLLVAEAIEAGKLSRDETLTCSETAAAKGGSQIWLEPGETMTVDDLLKATFVYSANDACTLLAETVAGSETAFVSLMNKKAAALGMKNTHFDNCTGLDDDTAAHLTTARDIALMARALLRFDFVKDYTTVWMDTLRNGKTQLVNTNRLIRTYPGATGLKTGTTSKAGCCVCATAERDGLSLIAVVLGADNSKARFAGAAALLDYGFANYALFTPSAGEAELPPVAVRFGVTGTVTAASDLRPLLVNKGAQQSIARRVDLPESVEAPVEKGQKLGTLRFFAGEKEIASFPLSASASVRRITLWDAMWRILTCVRADSAE